MSNQTTPLSENSYTMVFYNTPSADITGTPPVKISVSSHHNKYKKENEIIISISKLNLTKRIGYIDINLLLTISLYITKEILVMYIVVPAITILKGMCRVHNPAPFASNIKSTKKIEKVLNQGSVNFLSMEKPFTSKIILKNYDRNTTKRIF